MTTKSTTMPPILIDEKSLGIVGKFTLIILGSLLMTLSAKIAIPFWPVPSTLQSLAVVMLGIFLGPRLALGATMAYLLEGMVGIPVFADSLSYPGFAIFAKASAGFLISFPMAAYIAGWLAERGWINTTIRSFVLFALCTLVIYGIGMPWLIAFIGSELAWQNFLQWIPGNLAKVGLGMSVVRLYSRTRKPLAQ